MPGQQEYRTEHVAEAPPGGRVRTIASKGGRHQLVIWFPEGKKTGESKLLEILHPKDENTSCPVSASKFFKNPSELVIFGLNPSKARSQNSWADFLTKIEKLPAGAGAALDPVQGKHGKGKNPDDAVEMYQTFQGRDPREIVELHESAAQRLDYAALGDLEYLVCADQFSSEDFEDFKDSMSEAQGVWQKAALPEQSHVIEFMENDDIKLAVSPNGGQLYCIGGNQDLTEFLGEFTPEAATKDFIDLGYGIAVSYITQKAQNSFKRAGYFHILGEETGNPPRLMYDKLKRRIFFTGGEYEIKAEGIVN